MKTYDNQPADRINNTRTSTKSFVQHSTIQERTYVEVEKMRGRRNEHFWTYVGVSKGNERGEFKGELGHCPLCNKFRVSTTSGFTFITKKRCFELKIEGSENW